MTDATDAEIPRPQNRRLRTFLRTQGLGAISLLVSLLILIANVANYFWRPDNLVVYFRLMEPTEVGTGQLRLSYIFSNSGKTTAFIEDVSLVQVVYQQKTKSSDTPNFSLCKDDSIETPYVMAMEPPIVRSSPNPDEIGRSRRLYIPKTIYLSGVKSQFPSLNIEVGTQRAISAVFATDPVDLKVDTIVLLCPIVQVFLIPLVSRSLRYVKVSRATNFISVILQQQHQYPAGDQTLRRDPHDCCQSLVLAAASQPFIFAPRKIFPKEHAAGGTKL